MALAVRELKAKYKQRRDINIQLRRQVVLLKKQKKKNICCVSKQW